MSVTDFGHETPSLEQIEAHLQAMDLHHEYSNPRRVAILGTPSATAYGRHMAGEIAYDLTKQGWQIVTRLPDGIGEAAATHSRAAGGTPLTISASPCNDIGKLTREQANQVGNLNHLIPIHPNFNALPWSRIAMTGAAIAHLVDAVLVVETDHMRKHEATVTAAHRIWCPVYAVPGPVTSGQSTGCHDLIRDGRALMATSADHIEPSLKGQVQRSDLQRAAEAHLS